MSGVDHQPLKPVTGLIKRTHGGIKSIDFPDVQLAAADGTKLGMFTKIAVTMIPDGGTTGTATMSFTLTIVPQGWQSSTSGTTPTGVYYQLASYAADKTTLLDLWGIPRISIPCSQTVAFPKKTITATVYMDASYVTLTDTHPAGASEMQRCP
jgi:hypothetical protein